MGWKQSSKKDWEAEVKGDLVMTGGSRTTFYRDNHNEDNNKKGSVVFIGVIFGWM
jgi:hypothetical protein